MRGRAMVVSAVAALSVAVATGGPAAGVTVPPVPPVPTPPAVTVTVPPVVPSALPSPPNVAVPTAQAPSAPPAGGSASGGTAPSGTSTGTANSQPAAGGSSNATKATKAAKEKAAESPVNPVIAGRPGAADVVDDEATPALHKATQDFLKADQQIAGLAKLRDELAGAKAGAAEAAQRYKALQADIDGLRSQAETQRQRSDVLRRTIDSDVRTSYQTGNPVRSDQESRELAAAAARAAHALVRTETLMTAASAQQDQVRTEFDTFAARYNRAKDELTRISQRLEALAQRRAAALTAARQAVGPDQAQHRQTLAESGSLGAQIRDAAAHLAATGSTVNGTGDFIHPSSGGVTSGYGRRFHPILHYVKLHTGTDFAVGDGNAHAADDGRVLFTIVSQAYGNFTVIDHGVIDGRHITTAYAHQAKFLVKPGQAVTKGQTIGVIGSTGYATGPHLHFEVRDNGAVENPMPWLSN